MTKWNQFVISGVVAALMIAGCSKPQQTAQQAAPPSSTAPAAQAPAPQTPAPEANPQAPAGQQTPAQQQAAQTPAPAPAPEPAAPPPPPPPPPKPATFTIPAGSSVSVRTITGLSTKTNKTGDPFEATLAKALVSKGVVIAPKGARVQGVVTQSDSGGRVKGRASIGVDINAVETADGQMVAVHTTALQTEAKGTKKKDAAKIGIGAGVGAAIGAIAGGGTGAAIGAAAGGGGGTLLVLGTKGAPATIPSETPLNFTLSSSLKVTEKRPGSLKKAAAE